MLKKLLSSTKQLLANGHDQERYLQLPEGNIYYKIFSAKAKGVPLIVIHGGPGTPHDYLLVLSELSNERPVIFYDQLGCGKSPCEADENLWQVGRFKAELAALVRELAYPKVNILGHSWGSCIAAEYTLSHPEHVNKVILASPCLSIPMWTKDAERLIASLSLEHKIILEQGNKTGDYYSPEYQLALKEYYRRFIYNMDITPEIFTEIQSTFGISCYNYMWGNNEFTSTGTLKDYDVTAKLSEINSPCLFTCGRFDEATPETCDFYAKLINNGLMRVFENSAHFPHINESTQYIWDLAQFLK
ncbi:MAG: proline iminopeptidase-family hydrolase [Proteobacteria bacterium]|nr:proline iminopeptidase-family hydrolase [Pseudomonadota bacterium]